MPGSSWRSYWCLLSACDYLGSPISTIPCLFTSCFHLHGYFGPFLFRCFKQSGNKQVHCCMWQITEDKSNFDISHAAIGSESINYSIQVLQSSCRWFCLSHCSTCAVKSLIVFVISDYNACPRWSHSIANDKTLLLTNLSFYIKHVLYAWMEVP